MDDSCISNPKSRNRKGISNFGYEVQESSNFKISVRLSND
jgi:hypothetical protein